MASAHVSTADSAIASGLERRLVRDTRADHRQAEVPHASQEHRSAQESAPQAHVRPRLRSHGPREQRQRPRRRQQLPAAAATTGTTRDRAQVRGERQRLRRE